MGVAIFLELFGANLPGKRLVSGAHYRYVIPDAQPLKHQSNLRCSSTYVIIGSKLPKNLMKRATVAISALTAGLFFIFTRQVAAEGQAPMGTESHGLDPTVLVGVAIML